MSSATSTGSELGRANRTDIEPARFHGGTSLHTHRLGNDAPTFCAASTKCATGSAPQRRTGRRATAGRRVRVLSR